MCFLQRIVTINTPPAFVSCCHIICCCAKLFLVFQGRKNERPPPFPPPDEHPDVLPQQAATLPTHLCDAFRRTQVSTSSLRWLFLLLLLALSHVVACWYSMSKLAVAVCCVNVFPRNTPFFCPSNTSPPLLSVHEKAQGKVTVGQDETAENICLRSSLRRTAGSFVISWEVSCGPLLLSVLLPLTFYFTLEFTAFPLSFACIISYPSCFLSLYVNSIHPTS